MKNFKSIVRKFLPSIIVIVLIVGYFLTGHGRISLKTIILLSRVSSRVNYNVLPMLGEKYSVETVEIENRDRMIPADIYRPDNDKENPAVIFLIGTQGLPRSLNVQKYADLFARAGFVVLVPEIDDLVGIKMRDNTTDEIVAIFDYLYTRDFVDKNRVGFSGICAGASMSLLATEDLRINDKVKFVNVISPYFDTWDFTWEVFTNQVVADGKAEVWHPNQISVDQLKLWYLQQVGDTQEQESLKDMILNGRIFSQDELGDFSERGRAVHNFLRSDNDDEFAKNRVLLPDDIKFQVEAISPNKKVGLLKAKVFILADSLDTTVNPQQSRRLAQSLPKDQVKFSYISSLDHVAPAKRLQRLGLIQDAVKLFLHVHSFLSYLDLR